MKSEAHAALNEISWGSREGQRITPEEDAYYHWMLKQWQLGETGIPLEQGESPDEVDFVLTNGRRLLAIEVKSGARAPATHKGLAVFSLRFPKAHTLVVGSGGVPLHEFLSRSAEEWLQ